MIQLCHDVTGALRETLSGVKLKLGEEGHKQANLLITLHSIPKWRMANVKSGNVPHGPHCTANTYASSLIKTLPAYLSYYRPAWGGITRRPSRVILSFKPPDRVRTQRLDPLQTDLLVARRPVARLRERHRQVLRSLVAVVLVFLLPRLLLLAAPHADAGSQRMPAAVADHDVCAVPWWAFLATDR